MSNTRADDCLKVCRGREESSLARLAPFPKVNKLSSPEPATNADASADINGGPAVFHDDACNTMWLDSEGMEDDGPNATSGSPDRSSEDGIEPDFKVEDEYDVNFGDLDEEISRLIKPELSSKASLGLYSTPPAPTPQSNVPSPLSKREPEANIVYKEVIPNVSNSYTSRKLIFAVP